MSHDCRWALHNALKGWTLYDLDDREVQLVIKTMSINEAKLTHICQSGAAQWAKLTEAAYPQFFKKLVLDSTNYPGIDTQLTSSGIDTEYFVVRPKKVMFPRLHKRYEIEVPCFIFSTTRQFHSTTSDLSEGGLFFKDLIPEWVAGYFIVGVHSPDGIIQLMCSLVEDQKEKKRVQIVSEESDPQFIVYKDWLSRSSASN
ncbi:MAG: PilZ domain-containing protein [Bdellovibrionaceae bacterium]|nr:PilZ domain-containing protein [Bdellovibrio sp.]